jgi:hypothetical protein
VAHSCVCGGLWGGQVLAEYRAHQETEAALRFERRRRRRARAAEEQRRRDAEETERAAQAARTGRVAAIQRVKAAKAREAQAERGFLQRQKVTAGFASLSLLLSLCL